MRHRSVAAFLSAFPLLVLAQNDTLSVRLVHDGAEVRVSLKEIMTLTPRAATIKSHDGESATYEGVWLKEVLKINSPSITAIEKRTMVNSYVRVEAVDKYTALIALTECDSSFRERPVILAWRKNGQPLDEHNGPFQVIVPDDLRHARDVRQVARLEVIRP